MKKEVGSRRRSFRCTQSGEEWTHNEARRAAGRTTTLLVVRRSWYGEEQEEGMDRKRGHIVFIKEGRKEGSRREDKE